MRERTLTHRSHPLYSTREQDRYYQKLLGNDPAADSVWQQMSQSFAVAGEGSIDRLDLFAMLGDLPLQPLPFSFDTLQTLQQLWIHLTAGALLAGRAALDFIALALQRE